MPLITKKHPLATSTVVRRVKDGALVGFIKRIHTEEGWLERYKVDRKLHVATTADGKPRIVRENLAGKYEVITGVPPFIKVRDPKSGKLKLFRRADVIPTPPPAPTPPPDDTKHPAQIKVGGHRYMREDLARKDK
jgi:hypothetical protein